MLDVRVLFATREFCVAIILANEKRWQFPQRREVQGLVEYARAGGSVAEKDHADVLFAPGLGSPGCTRSEREVAAYNASGSEHAFRCVDEMHRAAAAAADTAVPSQNLRERRLDIGALSEHVTVAAMARKENVLRTEMRANAYSNRFLPGRQMRKPRHFARRGQPLHLPFEHADLPQRT